ncbi:MAG: cobalamin-binding protein [Betaproteobacteria bacterium]|nr:MAG: cobalamin-binding protein [Betaproteobacteria bacterium]TAG45105.1 MAG: cobalamin-binding protein [Betaproteobacteria bacterium]
MKANSDALGIVHRPFATARIACLVPSITETLFALGLGDQVVARTGFCIHPEPAVRDVPKVGGTKDVNVAKLIATEPTHVIVNIDENVKATVDHLRRVIPNVIVTHPITPEDNFALYRLLGHTFCRTEAAEALCDKLAAALVRAQAVAAKLPAETALYAIWKDPWMSVSRDTYISHMMASVGWKTLPIQADKRYPEVPDTDSSWARAERIFLSSEPYSFGDEHVSALKNQRRLPQPVQLIDGEMVSWYGVRAVAGIEYLCGLRELTAVSAKLPTS